MQACMHACMHACMNVFQHPTSPRTKFHNPGGPREISPQVHFKFPVTQPRGSPGDKFAGPLYLASAKTAETPEVGTPQGQVVTDARAAHTHTPVRDRTGPPAAYHPTL